MGSCEFGSEPSDSVKCGLVLTRLEPISFSRRNLLNGVSKYHTKRKGKRVAVAVLCTHAGKHAHILIECLGVNKNIRLHFC